MKILCISASNVKVTQGHGASTKICDMVKELIIADHPDAEVQVLSLLHYDLKPCYACGECFSDQKCPYDEAFNEIYTAMEKADGIVIVTPHYAVAPAKLVCLLEKIQERCYFFWLTKQYERFTLIHRPVAIIGHGGSVTGFEKLYRRNLLDAVGGALGAVGLKIIGVDDEWKNGVVFGIKSTKPTDDPLQLAMIHDWDEIKARISPLVDNLVKSVQESSVESEK